MAIDILSIKYHGEISRWMLYIEKARRIISFLYGQKTLKNLYSGCDRHYTGRWPVTLDVILSAGVVVSSREPVRKQPLQLRHNERDGVSNHRRFDCLSYCLLSQRTSKLRVTGLCAGNLRNETACLRNICINGYGLKRSWYFLCDTHWLATSLNSSTLGFIDPSHKSYNASDRYPTMPHFVAEMCTPVHISVTKWPIVGYGTCGICE